MTHFFIWERPFLCDNDTLYVLFFIFYSSPPWDPRGGLKRCHDVTRSWQLMERRPCSSSLSHSAWILWGGCGAEKWHPEPDWHELALHSRQTGSTGLCWMDCESLQAFLWMFVFDQLTLVWNLPQRISKYLLRFSRLLPCYWDVISEAAYWSNTSQWLEWVPFVVYASHLGTCPQFHNLICAFTDRPQSVLQIKETAEGKRQYYAPLPLSHIRHRTSNLSGGEALITVPTLPQRTSWPPARYCCHPPGCRELQGCSPPWSMVLSCVATPTSFACPGRAGCPRVRRRSRCAGSGTTRRAGWLLGMAEESSGSRSRPATVDGTGPLHRE